MLTFASFWVNFLWCVAGCPKLICSWLSLSHVAACSCICWGALSPLLLFYWSRRFSHWTVSCAAHDQVLWNRKFSFLQFHGRKQEHGQFMFCFREYLRSMEIFRRLLWKPKFANFLWKIGEFSHFHANSKGNFRFNPGTFHIFSLAILHMGLFLIARPLLCSWSAVNPTANPLVPVARLSAPPGCRARIRFRGGRNALSYVLAELRSFFCYYNKILILVSSFSSTLLQLPPCCRFALPVGSFNHTVESDAGVLLLVQECEGGGEPRGADLQPGGGQRLWPLLLARGGTILKIRKKLQYFFLTVPCRPQIFLCRLMLDWTRDC